MASKIDSLDVCQDKMCCVTKEKSSSNDAENCFCSHSNRCQVCNNLKLLLSSDSFDKIKIHKLVKDSGKFNFEGCRIVVNNKINGNFMRRMLRDYTDLQVVDLLQFGFPIGFYWKSVTPLE